MMLKLRRIGYLILIFLVLVFIFSNQQQWRVDVPFLPDYEMPAWSMLLLVAAAGFLIGFLTHVWMRKRKQAEPT